MISESLVKKIESKLETKLNFNNFIKENSINLFKKEEYGESDTLEETLEDVTQDFIKRFNEEMFEMGLLNSFCKTYQIKAVDKTPYGFNAEIKLVPGLNFIKLKENLIGLQQSLNCTLILENKNNKNVGFLKIVMKDIDTQLPFSPPKIKPNEICLGMSFTNEPIIIDCNKHCMFLIAGATGAGKTRYLYTILLSWLMSCSHTEIGLFLADLAKSEFCGFKDVKQVMSYAEELDELLLIMEFLNKEMTYRKTLLSRYRNRKENSATNISEYNEIEPTRKLKFFYVFIDEFSAVNPDATDTEEEKATKEKILAVIKKISKRGRSLGVFCILATQKTTKEELPPILKNMSAVRVSFRANDAISSEVILGDNSAVGLEDRIGLYSLNGGADKDYLFSSSLDINYMNSMIRENVDMWFKKEHLEDLMSVLDFRIKQIDKIFAIQRDEKERKESKSLYESSNLFKKPVLNYEIQDYKNTKVVSENKYPNTSSAKKPPKNGWYALEIESKKLKKVD